MTETEPVSRLGMDVGDEERICLESRPILLTAYSAGLYTLSRAENGETSKGK